MEVASSGALGYSGCKWSRVEPSGKSVASEFPRFSGSYELRLDDKGRLVVPARLRERLGGAFVITIAPPDPCLAIYPQRAWEAFCDRLEAAPRKDERYRRFVRRLFGSTEEVSTDGQGRLLIPPNLRRDAGIEREVVLVGTLTRVEMWSAQAYHRQPEVENVADLMTELGLY
ncbi:division/cell wall cluster transcriptional repressor MraZ [bacterium]|nr:MAG: division/cell wall cluster transcriptional repressor MraZ [bacterium]